MFHLTCTELKKLSQSEFWRFMNSFDTVLVSCQGVLWNFEREMRGSSTVCNKLREVGKQMFFLTNNSLRTRHEMVQHAERFGFVIQPDEIIIVSFLIAHYLKSLQFEGVVYAIGSKCLKEELDLAGIKNIGIGPDVVVGNFQESYEKAEINPNVRAVVVALDEDFSLLKLMKAATYLNNPECKFIAVSNEEQRSGFYPKVVPSTGAILASIEACSGRRAMVLGKPSKFICSYLVRHHCVDPQRTLFIGHRLIVDSLFGFNCGFSTLLVLTGITKMEEIRKMIEKKKVDGERNLHLPNLYAKSIEDLLYFLNLGK